MKLNGRRKAVMRYEQRKNTRSRDSPVVLACTVGVLTEVPVMLSLVCFINKTRHCFPEERGYNR